LVSLAVISAISAMDRGVAAQDATPAASPLAGCPVTTEDENEAIARRWHEDVINNHDLTVLDEILAPDAPSTQPRLPKTLARGLSSAPSWPVFLMFSTRSKR